MADLKSKHGFERAQFRRRPSVQIQALLTAAVINLKQLVKRLPEAQSGSAATLGTCLRTHLRDASLTPEGLRHLVVRLKPALT